MSNKRWFRNGFWVWGWQGEMDNSPAIKVAMTTAGGDVRRVGGCGMSDWHGIPEEYRNQIVTGDARVLAERIPDNSIDLIFTDPPYPREFLPLYGWLAEEAVRVLRPGGFVLAMCGGLYLNHIMRYMDAYLTYYWKYELELAGKGLTWQASGHKRIPIVVGSKPLLAYSKGISDPRTPTLGVFRGTGSDKQYHAWGQDVASTRYYVDCFSRPGDTVLDPFCGGGTTPYACEQLGRQWIAFENDPTTADTARERLQTVQMPLLAPGATQSALWEAIA